MNKGYTPKFNNAFEHFLLHTGGRAVIDEMEEKLSLTAAQCQPSKDALYRFGNTSAASTWCVFLGSRCSFFVRGGMYCNFSSILLPEKSMWMKLLMMVMCWVDLLCVD